MEQENTFIELVEIMTKYSKNDGINNTKIDGLHCFKMSELHIRLPVIYRPSIFIVAQGSKQVLLEKEVFQYSQGQYLVVSVDLPLIGEVTTASQNKPYLCAQIDIDAQVMNEIAISLNSKKSLPSTTDKGIFVGDVNNNLMSCVLRLIRLLDTPEDIPYLAPMLFQEIYYRLLSGPHGATIIQTCLHESNTQRIAKAINKIKMDITKPLDIKELARLINTSTSNFYSIFKKVTGLSPLQYLKRLRLTEARNILMSNNIDVTRTAYLVGYESPTQFNREYARLFGTPPLRDVKNLKYKTPS